MIKIKELNNHFKLFICCGICFIMNLLYNILDTNNIIEIDFNEFTYYEDVNGLYAFDNLDLFLL